MRGSTTIDSWYSIDAASAGEDSRLFAPTKLRKVSLIFSDYLEPFTDCPPLQQRLLRVLASLPDDVRNDFLDDPCFRIAMEEYIPGRGWSLWLAVPATVGSGSRSVVLRPRLADCSAEFAHYVIAHELAHAYLRNGGWGEISDREQAADALAASWGFVRPSS